MYFKLMYAPLILYLFRYNLKMHSIVNHWTDFQTYTSYEIMALLLVCLTFFLLFNVVECWVIILQINNITNN